MSESPIQWLQMQDGSQGHTWNPVTGCKKIGQGCKGCYAIPQSWMKQHHPNPKIAAKFFNVVQQTGVGLNWTGEVGFSETALFEPLKRRTPTKYFISLSDLFYDARPDDHIDRVIAVAALCQQHEIIILTKYIERAATWFKGDGMRYAQERVYNRAHGLSALYQLPVPAVWPLPNVTLGVSISTQKEADSLIPQLLRIPAARRIVSAEPLIEEVDLRPYMWPVHWAWDAKYSSPAEAIAAGAYAERKRQALVSAYARFLDGVIVGGESGPGARPCDVAWIRSVVRQCREANVPCFVKQLGADPREGNANANCRNLDCTHPDCAYIRMKLTDKKGGDISEWPEDLRVRHWPEVPHA